MGHLARMQTLPLPYADFVFKTPQLTHGCSNLHKNSKRLASLMQEIILTNQSFGTEVLINLVAQVL